MLRDLLGEDVFFRGIKEFFQRFKYQAARTGDFVVTMSEISGQDLGPFFRGWFMSHVLPEVKVTHHIERADEDYLLKFHIAQLRDPFVFPLWVEWIQDGERVRKMIIVDKKEHTAEFKLPQKPTKIKVNPDKAVPGKFY